MEYTISEYFTNPKLPRYQFVYKVLGNFVNHEIPYPLTVGGLLKLCEVNGITCIPYTSFHRKAVEISNDGFSFCKNGLVYIFYNEMQLDERIKFTLAHELGHIVLGHLMLEEQTDALEKEANCFARNLVVPAKLVKLLKCCNEQDITDKFKISYSCAIVRLNLMNRDYNAIVYESEPIYQATN